MRRLFPVFVFGILLAQTVCVAAQDLTVRDIMAEPSIAGMRVEGEKLSPDGSKVAYLWNAEGKMPRDLYMVSTSGGQPVRLLGPRDLPPLAEGPSRDNKLDYGLIIRDDFVKAHENQIGGLEWSPDSKKLLFSQNGDIYVLTLGETKPKRYTKTQSPEVAVRFIDDDRIMFQQNGNIFVLNIADATLVQVSKEANPQNFIAITNATTTKDGKLVAYVVSDSSKQKALVVPNYLDEFVQASTVRRGWSEQKILVTPTDGSHDTPFEIKLPKSEGVSNFRVVKWAADGRSLIVDRNDKDTKRRQLFYAHNVGSKDEQVILITEETDDKWQAPLSSIFEPNPKDPGQLFFCSEKDGFNHIYLATLQKNEPVPNPTGEVRGENPSDPGYSPSVEIKQLTKGSWQVDWAKWVANGKQIVLSSTETGTAIRNFFVYNAATKEKDRAFPGDLIGMKLNPQMDDQNAQPLVLYGLSTWDLPDELIAFKLCPGNSCADKRPRPVQLTSSVSDAFSKRKWNEPKFIDIPSRDGKQIKSKIYFPTGFSTKQKYPMVIFVHGAGYLQNVINGWNNYYREFMFNELLTQKGYIVLDIDYRGSSGYGRDWRTDVYDFLGGKDFDDHIDAIDYMVKNYAVNPRKIGVYGGSYGGFMAEMLAFRAPDKIAAAAALRPVADWKNYYASSPGYTAQRLGFPDKNPEAYKRSSPISYADGLKTPLLILHGLSDDNVHVQDSLQLVEKLVRLGKTQYFETMFYPSENHGFVRPESWTDEYERILAFFEKHLK
jgi:dipeptidyl aminopeptidase/acylaminoacyl peptidase